MDKLIEIPHQNWIQLRDLYLIDWPQNIVGYHTIDNYIRWFDQKVDLHKFRIYSLNGDWSDGTFVIIDEKYLITNTLNENKDRLKKALSLLNWEKGYLFATLIERHRTAVYEVLKSMNLFINDNESKTFLYHIPCNEAKLLDDIPPAGISLKPIAEEDVHIADNAWPNQFATSLDMLKKFAKYNCSVAAYSSSGEMLAWTFTGQTGALIALQVQSDQQRKGLGSLVLRAIAKQWAALNMDTFGCVATRNAPSYNMFEKVGFKCIDNAYWFTASMNSEYDWTDV